MKKILFILFCIFTIQIIGAQSNTKDIVHLRNGSMIKGTITELTPNDQVKITTTDGSVFVYKMGDVEKITKEETPRYYRQKVVSDRGYRGHAELGYTIGTGDFNFNRVELLTSHGYQFNSWIYLGGGTGFQFYRINGDTYTAMPLFADFRVNFATDKEIIPFATVKLGYTVDLSDDLEDLGFYFAPAVGVKFKLKDKMAMNVSLGYTLQNVEVYYYSYGTSTENMGGVSLKVGFEF